MRGPRSHTDGSPDEAQVDARVRELLAMSIVWDNHACLPLSNSTGGLVKGLDLYRRSGVSCVHVNIGDADTTFESQMRVAAAFRADIAAHPVDFLLASHPDDIVDAKASGRLAVCFDLEGLWALQGQLSLIELYRDIGVRWISLAYNLGNEAGGGCHDSSDGGLTSFGRSVVHELDRCGVVKDCSHAGYRTAMEVMEASALPVTFSHSNPRTLCDHPRNIPDHLIRECARTGGVIGICGVGIFVGRNDTSTGAFVRHIEYVADLVGPEHVGLGLDYVTYFDEDHGQLIPAGSTDFWPAGHGYDSGVRFIEPTRISEIAAELVRRGWSDAEARGVLGGNFLRVARQVWN